jgi:rubrerythrin
MKEADELLAAMAAAAEDRGETNVSRLLRKYIEAAEARHARNWALTTRLVVEAGVMLCFAGDDGAVDNLSRLYDEAEAIQ